MTRTVFLPQYQFEGPLDLLLSLIRQNQCDIQNLPVAEVTRQFLAYLEAANGWTWIWIRSGSTWRPP